MAQQVDDLHRPGNGLGDELRHGAGLGAERRDAADIDAEVLPLRDVLVHRLVDRDAPLLHQHHERDRGDRLGHRVDAEDGVVLDRRLALDIGKTLDGRMNELAAPVDDRLRAGEAARIDVVALQVILEPAEAGRRHADGFRRSGRRMQRRRRGKVQGLDGHRGSPRRLVVVVAGARFTARKAASGQPSRRGMRARRLVQQLVLNLSAIATDTIPPGIANAGRRLLRRYFFSNNNEQDAPPGHWARIKHATFPAGTQHLCNAKTTVV